MFDAEVFQNITLLYKTIHIGRVVHRSDWIISVRILFNAIGFRI